MGQIVRFKGQDSEIVDVPFKGLGKEAEQRRQWAMVVLGSLLALQFQLLLGLHFMAGWYFSLPTRKWSLVLMLFGISMLTVATGGRDWPTRLLAHAFAGLGAIATVGFALGL